MTDFDIQMGQVIRNGILIGVLGALAVMVSCSVANRHYDYLDKQLEQTRYLATRPW